MKRKALSDISNSAIQHPTTAPIQLLSERRKTLPLVADACMPKDKSIYRDICRKRSKLLPKEPKTVDEFDLGDVKTYMSEQEFLLYDSKCEGTDQDGRRLIVFSTSDNLFLLAKSTQWFLDGTFRTCPRIFRQIYVIMGQCSNIFVPLVFALMSHKVGSLKFAQDLRKFAT